LADHSTRTASDNVEAGAADRAQNSTRRRDGVTVRSVLLALLLIPFNAFWLVEMDQIRGPGNSTTVSLFFNCVFLLLVLTALNWLLSRFIPRAAFSQAELLVVYVMLTIASALCGPDTLEDLVPCMTWPFRHADSSNQWSQLFFKYLPQWLMVSDEKAYQGYYLGNSSFYSPAVLRAWAGPILFWTLFIMLLLFVMLCLNALLRKQWTEHERLSYPIVQLPFEMTRGADEGKPAEMFFSRVFWLGFGLAAGVDLVNALNLYFPAIPTILSPGFGRTYLDLSSFVPNRPWNAISWTPLTWTPFLVGLGMLLPLDFLFSAWFFYLFWKLEAVFTVAVGWDSDPRFPYIQEQSFGAYMAFLLFTVVLAKGYLKQVFLRALGKASTLDDSEEPMSYRGACLGIIGGMTGLVIFSMVAGMSGWLAVMFFLLFFGLCLAITRMRAEFGTPVHDLHFTGPDWMLSDLIGTRNLSPLNLTVFSVYFWFNRAYREVAMPQQLEGLKLAQRTGTSYRKLSGAMMLAGLAGTLAGFWALLSVMYHYGAEAKAVGTLGYDDYTRLASWLQSPKDANLSALCAVVVGLAVCLFLETMRVRFPWWPLHPLAFAVTSSWEINLVWFPLFLSWLSKALIVRYGGRSGYRSTLPFFFGLILGQFAIHGILVLTAFALGVKAYEFW
jgi:hypothetical protein